MFPYFASELANLHPKFPKSTNEIPKKYPKTKHLVIKTAEFYADFRPVSKILKICMQKGYEQNCLQKGPFCAFTHTLF